MTRAGFTTVLASNGAEAINAILESDSSKHQVVGVEPRFDVILVSSLSFKDSALLTWYLHEARWIFKCQSCKPQRRNTKLLSSHMPTCRDGFAATKEIRRLEAAGTLSTRHFIIAVTGNARSEQVQAAWDSGVDKVMIKVSRRAF